MYDLIHNHGQHPPCNSMMLGHQNDGSGSYWLVIVNTPNGRIPGKARAGKAWYSFGGKEHESTDFHWIKVARGYRVHQEKCNSVPHGAVVGFQHNNNKAVFGVICHTPHGHVPGKSNGQEAHYGWGGKEETCRNFSYIVVRQ